MPLRILLLTDNYLPHQGGSRVYCHQLFHHLDGVERTVLTRAQPGDAEFDRAQAYGIVRCRFSDASEAGGKMARALRLARIHADLFRHARSAVRRLSPDIILANELIPTGPVAALIARGRPFVLIAHAEGPSTLARTRWQSRVARWVCGRAQAIVAASELTKTNLVELLGARPDAITVLTPGVGEEHLAPEFAASPCSDPSRPRRILSVGRLIPRKNHLRVLEALPRVLEQLPGLEYTIAGSGPLENEIRDAIARLGLDANVRLLGETDSADLMREFARSDCFVLPNIDNPITGDAEGFGIVFLEASAHGLPVIGGRTPGTSESILDKQAGLRIDGNAPEAIATAILTILTNPALAQEYGRQGRRYVQTQMRWPDRAARFRALLENLTP